MEFHWTRSQIVRGYQWKMLIVANDEGTEMPMVCMCLVSRVLYAKKYKYKRKVRESKKQFAVIVSISVKINCDWMCKILIFSVLSYILGLATIKMCRTCQRRFQWNFRAIISKLNCRMSFRSTFQQFGAHKNRVFRSERVFWCRIKLHAYDNRRTQIEPYITNVLSFWTDKKRERCNEGILMPCNISQISKINYVCGILSTTTDIHKCSIRIAPVHNRNKCKFFFTGFGHCR